MLLMTEYQVKRFASKEEVAELMGVFAQVGSAPGTISHWIAADGSKGYVIAESDDVEAMYRNTLEYGRWLDFKTTVVLAVEDAVPHIMDALSS